MSTKQIEMTRDQVEAIVIEELKESLELEIECGRRDRQLTDALKTVIMYYMAPSAYQLYFQQIGLTSDSDESPIIAKASD